MVVGGGGTTWKCLGLAVHHAWPLVFPPFLHYTLEWWRLVTGWYGKVTLRHDDLEAEAWAPLASQLSSIIRALPTPPHNCQTAPNATQMPTYQIRSDNPFGSIERRSDPLSFTNTTQ